MKNQKALAVFSVTFGVLGGYMVATGTISSLYGADDGKSAAKTNAPQITGVPGSPSATETLRGKQIPCAAAAVWWRDQGDPQGIQDVVATAHRATQGRAERPADHDRRQRLINRA